MSRIDPEKNCHEYCPYGKACRFADGEKGIDFFECGMYYKLDDLMQDARDIAEEQRRNGKDFYEEDDW